MTTPRVLFAGTPAFARESLAALLAGGIRPLAVLTQPDRPAGRGRKLTPSPVKELALEEDIPVLQPTTLRKADSAALLAGFEADLLIVAAYGLILPQAILDTPRLGCLNVHASALPRWRGAAPIQASLLHGDPTTGISLMQMEAGLDTGPVYVTSTIEIGERETAGELHDRLATLGGELLVASLDDIVTGRLEPVRQNNEEATYAGKISREDAKIDWSRTAVEIDRQVRAFNPVPGAWTEVLGESVKVWRTTVVDASGGPGQVIVADSGGLVVSCGDQALRIETLQRPGKRRIDGVEFAGQRSLDGVRFGQP